MGKIQSLEIENTIGKNVSEFEKLCYQKNSLGYGQKLIAGQPHNL